MYRIAVSKILLEQDSTGYQTNYPAGTGTGYLNTCCTVIRGQNVQSKIK